MLWRLLEELPDETTSRDYYFGIIFATLGCLSGSLGDNIVRYSFNYHDTLQPDKDLQPALFKRPLWVIGILSTVLLNTAFVLTALAFADATLVIPFAGLHIFMGVCFARCINGEVIGSVDAAGAALILCGVLTVALSANKDDEPAFTLDRLIELAQRPLFLACVPARCHLRAPLLLPREAARGVSVAACSCVRAPLRR